MTSARVTRRRHRADRRLGRPGRAARRRTRRAAGTPTRPRSRGGARAARSPPADSLAEALAGAELVVVAAPVAALAAAGRRRARGDRRAARPSPTSARRRRASSPRRPARARFVGGHPIAGSEARGAENASAGPLRGRDLVSDADRRHRRRAPPPGARLRRRARRRSRVAIDPQAHDRLVALISHLPHVLANLIVNQAGAHARRRARPARERRRLAARHDADRRGEPAHVDGRPARQRRRGPRRSSPSCAQPDRARSRRRSPAATATSSPRFIGEAAAQPPAHARAVASRDAGALHRVQRPRRPTGPACSPRSRRRSAPSGSTSRTSGSSTSRPSAAARVTLLVTGARARPAAPPSCSRARATGSSSRRCSMRVEPAARVDGHIGVPGDKSISHRALLIGALGEGETRVSALRALRRHARRRSRPCARSASQVEEEDVDTLRRRTASACAACARPAAARLRQRRHARTPAQRDPRLPGGPLRARRRRVALARARWGASSSRSQQMGASLAGERGPPAAARSTAARCTGSTTRCRSRARR